MGYQAPSLRDLRQTVADLEKSYEGDNPQRHSFILLLKQLVEKTQNSSAENARNILLGAIIFELEVINAEYRFPWFKRSTVDAKLYEKLNLGKHNQLKDDERFVYLHEFYKYIIMIFPERHIHEIKENTPSFSWKNKDALITSARRQLKSIRERDCQFEKLVHAVPRLGALQKSTEDLCANYRLVAAAKNNADRVRLIEFIEFVHHASNYLFKDEYKKIPRMYQIEQDTRRSLILFALLNINGSYRALTPQGGYFRSGSQLFKDGLQVLNISSLDNIPTSERIKLLEELSRRIDEINKFTYDPDFSTYLEAKGIKKPEDMDDKIKDVATYINEQEKLKLEPGGATAALSSFAEYATQTTAKSAMQSGVGSYAIKGAFGMAAVSIVGPMGLVGLGALSCIGSMVGDGIISSMTASLYDWLLDKVGTSIGAVAAGTLASRYSITDEGINELRKQLTPEDEHKFCCWVNALLSAPLDVVTEVEKDNIRHVFGLEKGAQLQPLEQFDLRHANMSALTV